MPFLPEFLYVDHALAADQFVDQKIICFVKQHFAAPNRELSDQSGCDLNSLGYSIA